jgi:hypothetical protein
MRGRTRNIAGAVALAVFVPGCERHQQAAPAPPLSTVATVAPTPTAGPTATPPRRGLDPRRNFDTEEVRALGQGTGTGWQRAFGGGKRTFSASAL